MDPAIAGPVLTCLDLLLKILYGRDPRGKTKFQISENRWDTYYDVPAGDERENSSEDPMRRVHFVVDMVVSHSENTVIHEAILFLIPRADGELITLHSTNEHALYHSGGPEVGESISQFAAKNPPFQPTNFKAKVSQRIKLPAYGRLRPSVIDKEDGERDILVALRIGTAWAFCLVRAPLGGTRNARVHKHVEWRDSCSDATPLKVLGRYSRDESKFGAIAKRLTPFKLIPKG